MAKRSSLNVDMLLVSKIIQEKDIGPVSDLPPYFLFDDDYRKAYEYVRRYYSDHGQVPSVRIMRADCNVALEHVDEPWEDLIKRVQQKYIKGILNENLDMLQALNEADDIQETINLLGITASKVHTAVPNKNAEDVAKTGEKRLAQYLERRDNPNTLVGIPSGFPTIDKATQGFQKGQLITVTGLPKASKSVIAMRFAMAAQQYGKKVLYLTYEMTCDEQTNRLDAYRAGFNDNKLVSGNMTDEEVQRLTEGIHATAELAEMRIMEDVMTVTAIGAECDIFDADIVIVDGVYMMDDEYGEPKGSPMALAHIVAGLKFLAMRRKICVVAVTQSTPARTKGEVLNNDSIMGSRAFIQYSNVVIGIERVEDPMHRKLRIIMSRSCAPCDTMLEFNFDTAEFYEIENYDLDDEFQELMDGESEFTNTF